MFYEDSIFQIFFLFIAANNTKRLYNFSIKLPQSGDYRYPQEKKNFYFFDRPQQSTVI